jgi:hypothetical protein
MLKSVCCTYSYNCALAGYIEKKLSELLFSRTVFSFFYLVLFNHYLFVLGLHLQNAVVICVVKVLYYLSTENHEFEFGLRQG